MNKRTPAGALTRRLVPIREPETGKLLFRFDPSRLIIEIQRRRRRTVIDLKPFLQPVDRTKIL